MAKYTLILKLSKNYNILPGKETIPEAPTSFDSQTLSIDYNATNEGQNNTCRIDSIKTTTVTKDKKTTTSQSIGNGCSFCYDLEEFSLKKEVYKPGHLEFKLHISQLKQSYTGDNAVVIEEQLPSFFKETKVSLKKEDDEIAVNYCICNYQLKKWFKDENDANGQPCKTLFYDILIHAYSPDYLLTQDKNSKAYTGKKLWENIIMPDIPIKPKQEEGMSDKDYTEHLKNVYDNIKDNLTTTFWPKYLMDQIDFKNDDPSKPYHIRMNLNRLRYGTDDKEFIQPYLVQYDESPYDFIVRVMNRCGEYFYYEKGSFVFGWIEPSLLSACLSGSKHEKTSTEEGRDNYSNAGNNIYDSATYTKDVENIGTKIDSYVTYESVSSIAPISEVISVIHDYTKEGTNYKDEFKVEKSIVDKTTQNYDAKNVSNRYIGNNTTSDENLFVMPDKDGYINSFSEYPWEQLFPLFMGSLNEDSLGEMLSSLLWTEGLAMVAQAEFFLPAKQTYDEKIYTLGAYEDDRKQDDKHKNAYSTSKAKHKIPEGSPIVLSNDFYKDIAKGIQEAENGRIKYDLGTNFYSIFLGSIITIGENKYIVVSIEDGCKVVDSNKTPTCRIEAILYMKDKTKLLYPPMVNNNVFTRKSKGTQRAFVVVNLDPLRMNRVRVRFAWQQPSDDMSPWIRVTLPMAGDSRGFNFTPDAGDEAIINFEDDNIEKPFVEGWVYNEDNKPDPGLSNRGAALRSITSGNGHSIIFSDPANGLDAIKAYVPAWKFLSAIIPMKYLGGPGGILDDEGKPKDVNQLFRTAVGGIELADKIGFYSIKASTDKRAITIESPFGKVDINAFTGINISAPLGTVNIEGKNVNITARNNLKIESGTNIDSYWPGKDPKAKALKVGATVGISLFQRFMPVDMVLARTIYEAILRPVGGRLLLKSHSNLCMEAGESAVNPMGQDTSYTLYDEIYSNLQQLQMVFTACQNAYPNLEDVTNVNAKVTDILNQVKNNQNSDYNVIKDKVKSLKNGTKIDPGTVSQNSQQWINELNNMRFTLKEIDKKFKGNYFDAFVKEQVNSLNLNPDVKEFFKSVQLNKFNDCFSDKEVPMHEDLDFSDNKIKIKVLDKNLQKKERELFYTLFHSWYIKKVPVDNVIQLTIDRALNMGTNFCDEGVWSNNIAKIGVQTTRPNGVFGWALHGGGKFLSFVKDYWGWKGVSTELMRKQRHTGKILFASGDGAFTYALNKSQIELFSTSSSVAIGRIKRLLMGI